MHSPVHLLGKSQGIPPPSFPEAAALKNLRAKHIRSRPDMQGLLSSDEMSGLADGASRAHRQFRPSVVFGREEGREAPLSTPATSVHALHYALFVPFRKDDNRHPAT